jgi:BASS family bile acid:Na+ symporter
MLFDLPKDLAVGLILVASCPGGTASNVIAYIARADVALSVTMTAISTLLAIFLTPVLTSIYASSRVDIPEGGLFLSTFQVVLVPVGAGLLLHRFASKFEKQINTFFPAFAVLVITMIVASIVGSGKKEILENGFKLLFAVFLLHSAGFLLGYTISIFLTKSKITSRTISIEVGMQNSGLGVVLARQNFASPLTAIPSAISSLFHSVIGSVLAAIWRRREKAKDE